MLADVLNFLPRLIFLAYFIDAWSRRMNVYGGSDDIMLMTLLHLVETISTRPISIIQAIAICG